MKEEIKIILTGNDSLLLSSSSKSLIHLERCFYLSEGLTLYIAGRENTVKIQQMHYNPEVSVCIGKGEDELILNGIAKQVKAHPKKEEMIKVLSEKDSLSPEGIFNIVLYEIIPLRISSSKTGFIQEFPENVPSQFSEIIRSITTSVKMWMRAMRFPFLIASVSSVLVGGAVAYYETGFFNWFNYILTILGIAFIHAGVDLLNDFYL